MITVRKQSTFYDLKIFSKFYIREKGDGGFKKLTLPTAH